MSKKRKTEAMVGVVEASIRILMDHGFTRDEALQLMLSQIAVQVSPEIMRLGVTLSENHHEDFAKAEWRGREDAVEQEVGSVEYALGPL
jgi:hypothetical protein